MDGCTKSHMMETRAQKLAGPCLQGKPAGFQEEEDKLFLWSKMIMVDLTCCKRLIVVVCQWQSIIKLLQYHICYFVLFVFKIF